MELIFNNQSCIDFDTFLYDIPVVTSSNEKYSNIVIGGRRGALISKNNSFDNIKIKCVLSVLDDTKSKIRNIKRWLRGKGKLQISDDSYYDVLMIEHGDIEWELTTYGRFNIEFICFPYEFMNDGSNKIVPGNVLTNAFDEAMPIYFINGEGLCTLTVNGKSMTANVGQNLTLDTRRFIAYREDGSLQNTSVNGNYDDLWLIEGDNSIEISNGFTLSMIPNWGYKA